jgi:hypothetical protein
MRNAWVIRILVVLILMVWCSDSFAQYKRRQMFVPYRSQQTGKWCWAASMKMIMDFHNPKDSAKFTQCDLVKRLVKFTRPDTDTSSTVLPCCTSCSSICPSSTGNCESPLNKRGVLCTSEFMGSNPAHADNYDLIFSSYGYSSIQKINWSTQPMSWLEVKQQIDDCRPFIINIEATAVEGATGALDGNHALVVVGYEQLSGPNNPGNGVIAYDPWQACCGKNQVFFPYDIFTPSSRTSTAEGRTYFVNRVLSTVQCIGRDTLFVNGLSNCQTCDFLSSPDVYNGNSYFTESNSRSLTDITTLRGNNIIQPVSFTARNNENPPIDSTSLLDVLRQKGREIIGYTINDSNKSFGIDSSTYENILRTPGYYDAPVQYISANLVNRSYFLACLFPPRKLSKVVLTGYQVVDVVSGNVDTNLVSTLQKAEDGSWMLRRIATYTSIDTNLNVRINESERSVKLSNTRKQVNPQDVKKYTLIKYVPEQYEFFGFKLDSTSRTTYLAPAENYSELGLSKHVAYREQQVIRTLRRETRELDRIIRRLFENDRFRGNQTGRLSEQSDFIQNK